MLVLSPASSSWFWERCGSNFLLCKTACLQRRLSSSQLRLAMTQEGKNTKVLSNALITLCLGTSAVLWHARESSENCLKYVSRCNITKQTMHICSVKHSHTSLHKRSPLQRANVRYKLFIRINTSRETSKLFTPRAGPEQNHKT